MHDTSSSRRPRPAAAAALTASLMLAVGCAPASPAAGPSARPVVLFDGRSLDGWEHVGPGGFVLEPDGSMVSEGGMGLLYYAPRSFRDFVLELDYRTETRSGTSGVFVRFPELPADPWDAVHAGYEIQINDAQEPLQMTGSIYSFAPPFRLASRPPGEWNRYRIEVAGQRYRVWLNGEPVNDFFGERGREGYIGVQNHDANSRVRFRDIRVTPLRDTGAPESLAELFAVDDGREPIRVLMVTATHGFRHVDAIRASRELMTELARTTEFRVDFTEDVESLSAQNLADYDLLFFANSTLRTEPPAAARDGEDTTFAITLDAPDGQLPGELRLGTDDGAPTGSIGGAGFPATALAGIAVDGANRTFHFENPEYGRIHGRVEIQDDRVRGVLTVAGTYVPLRGSRIRADAAGAAYTPVGAAQREAILEFVRTGNGVAVAHSGLDAFYEWPEYRALVGGGLFESHPWTQHVRIAVEAPDHAAVAHFGDGFWIRDEIYVLDRNPRADSRVLLSLDLASLGEAAAPAAAGDYPISWFREHQGGRVFVTSLGHFADVWRMPGFVEHLLQGMRIAAGRVDADLAMAAGQPAATAPVEPVATAGVER